MEISVIDKASPLISVIVPVYNVEEYIADCLQSILGQSYTHLEVIIVNDGSTDTSASICEEYAQRDTRVHIVHQENKGLAGARNTGLEKARGEYIAFVDSDDEIELHMLQCLMESLQRCDSDIAICAYALCHGEHKTILGMSPVEKCTSKEALLYLFEDDWLKNFAWNKLFKKEFFSAIRFPLGCNFEDIPVMYKVFEKAQSVSFVAESLYNYRVRASSIIGSRKLYNELYACEHHQNRIEDLLQRRPDLVKFLWKPLVRCLMHTIFIGVQNPLGEQKKARLRRAALADFMKKHELDAFGSLNVSWRWMYTLTRQNNFVADAVVFSCTVFYKAFKKYAKL